MDTVVLSRLLASKNKEEASAAERLLAEAATQSQAERAAAVAVLVAALEQDERRVKARSVAGGAVGIGAVGAFAAGIVWAATAHGSGFFPFWVFFIINGRDPGRALIKRAARCSALRARVALALAQHGDVRAIGPLVEAWAANRAEAPRPAVTDAIESLLPAIRAGALVLRSERQSTLHDALLARWNPRRQPAPTPDETNGILTLLRLAALVGYKDTEAAVMAITRRHPENAADWRVIEEAWTALATISKRVNGTFGAPLPHLRGRKP